MSLDSTETFSNVMEDTPKNETKLLGRKVKYIQDKRLFHLGVTFSYIIPK